MVGGENPIDGFVDVLLGDNRNRALQRECAEIHDLDRGQHFERERVSKIGRAVEDLFDLGFVLGQRDLRLECGTFFVLGQGLAAGVSHGLLQHVGHHRAAIDLTQMRFRHMAGPKALDLRFVFELIKACREPLFQLIGADDHL